MFVSYQQMQHALTNLVRHPQKYQGEKIKIFLANFDLTDLERKNLEHIYQDKFFQKYAKTMANIRFGQTIQELSPLFSFLNMKKVEQFWFEDVEPQLTKVPFEKISLSFLEFLLASTKGKDLLLDGPVFLTDLVQFKYKEQQVGVMKVPPPNLYFNHGNYALIRLNFPVHTIGPGTKECPDQQCFLLITKNSKAIRSFELDQHSFENLKLLETGVNRLGESYESFVDIGLLNKN